MIELRGSDPCPITTMAKIGIPVKAKVKRATDWVDQKKRSGYFIKDHNGEQWVQVHKWKYKRAPPAKKPSQQVFLVFPFAANPEFDCQKRFAEGAVYYDQHAQILMRNLGLEYSAGARPFVIVRMKVLSMDEKIIVVRHDTKGNIIKESETSSHAVMVDRFFERRPDFLMAKSSRCYDLLCAACKALREQVKVTKEMKEFFLKTWPPPKEDRFMLTMGKKIREPRGKRMVIFDLSKEFDLSNPCKMETFYDKTLHLGDTKVCAVYDTVLHEWVKPCDIILSAKGFDVVDGESAILTSPNRSKIKSNREALREHYKQHVPPVVLAVNQEVYKIIRKDESDDIAAIANT